MKKKQKEELVSIPDWMTKKPVKELDYLEPFYTLWAELSQVFIYIRTVHDLFDTAEATENTPIKAWWNTSHIADLGFPADAGANNHHILDMGENIIGTLLDSLIIRLAELGAIDADTDISQGYWCYVRANKVAVLL